MFICTVHLRHFCASSTVIQFLIAEQNKSSQEKREESVTELREGLLKMVKCVLDVGDAVILSLDGKDPLECTHQELLIAHDLLKSRWSCKRILKVTSIVAQSATIMEQNAQNNEHRRRLSFFWENGRQCLSVLDGCCPESSASC